MTAMPTHEITVRVRYQETDGQRRVHHANYLNYFEVARTEMLRASGITYRELEDAGVFLVVSEANCSYKAPADYDDLLTIRTWIEKAQQRIAFQGLPARILWLGYGERHKAGLAFNELVRTGKVKAPIVIGRDHLDCGSVASPNRETEGMKDGSDAVADWPILNALGFGTLGGESGFPLGPHSCPGLFKRRQIG